MKRLITIADALGAILVVSLLACLAGGAHAGPVSVFASPTGGAANAGTVYEVHGRLRTVIYDFCREEGCVDGAAPLSELLVMPDGSLVGATTAGGTSGYGADVPPAGVLFRLQRTSDGAWLEEVLYSFCPYYADCTHFGLPSGSLHLVSDNEIEGVLQTSDGAKGVRWRFKLVSRAGGGMWAPIQSWTR